MLIAACALGITSEARADVSSWLLVGSGPAWLSRCGGPYELAATLRIDAGLGTSSAAPMVVGAVVSSNTLFRFGTDLSMALRGATSGFARGDWGVALDTGLFKRWWGDSSWGPVGAVHLGAPFGVQLSVHAALGRDRHRTFQAVFGVDLLRLTVHRTSGQEYWKNPKPAYAGLQD